MAVAVEKGSSFTARTPELIFQKSYDSMGCYYSVAQDGRRFLMMKYGAVTAVTQISIVANWFEELKQRVPAK